ncbi:hypothetical protein [Streptomyces sp. NPDC002132]|uniref:hypothetical protein n=1 Tax=unclassified Streptomyces TaxID=2593676 RepID=UPI0033245A3C
MRAILVARQVGPDAVPPKPTERPRDWLDAILDADPAPAEKPAAPQPDPAPAAAPSDGKAAKRRPARAPRKPKTPGAARTAWDTRPPAPRQSLTEAWDRVPYRLKWLGYHATAAYLGWTCGLVDWATHVTAWIATTSPIGPQALFWYATAGGTALIYRRTRAWWWPVAWLAAVPVSSTVVGVLLYAPTQ